MHYKYIFSILFLLLMSSLLFAHHGKDFIVTETTELPDAKSYWLILSGDFGAAEQFNSEHTVFEFTPGILYGITNSLAFEAHPHLGKDENEDFTYESTGFQLRYNLPRSDSHFQIGLSSEYEIASKSEHENLLDLRLIISTETEKYKIVLNAGIEIEEETSFVTRLGIVSNIFGNQSFAIELLSKFGDETNIDIIPSWTYKTNNDHALRLGLGISTDEERPFLSLRSILIFSL